MVELFAAVLMVLAFTAGFTVLPLTALVLGGLLPAFLAEPLSTLLLAVVLLAQGPSTWEWRENNTYHLVPDTERGPERHRFKFCLQRVGVSFRATKEAFAGFLSAFDPEGWAAETRFDDTSIDAAAGPGRAGVRDYVDLRERMRADLYVSVGRALAVFRGASGIDLSLKAAVQGEIEYGGDSKQYSGGTMLAGMVLFVLIGATIGFLQFFA